MRKFPAHMEKLAEAPCTSVDGKPGSVALLKDGDITLLRWAESGGESEDYFVESMAALRLEGSNLTLMDESGEAVFRCVLAAEPAHGLAAWQRELSGRGAGQQNEAEALLREQMLAGLKQLVKPKPRLDMASYVTRSKIEALLQHQDAVDALAQHLPPALRAEPDLRNTLLRVTRTAEFRQAGADLTDSLYQERPDVLFNILGLPIPVGGIRGDPVEALLNALSST